MVGMTVRRKEGKFGLRGKLGENRASTGKIAVCSDGRKILVKTGIATITNQILGFSVRGKLVPIPSEAKNKPRGCGSLVRLFGL